MATETKRRIPKFTYGERMEKARKEAGYSRHALADALGISSQSLVNYELDRHRPLRAIYRAWLERVNVDEHWLVTGCDCQEPETCRLTVGCSAD